MAVTAEESALAEKVVEKSKKEAVVDTGRLKRSINKKVQRGIIVFREFFYGQYASGDGEKNSTLEENAKSMMGNIPYKIERLDEDGNIVDGVNKASSGRIMTYENKKKRESQAKNLMQKLISKQKKDAAEEERNKDN